MQPQPSTVDFDRIARIEAAAARSWPAAHSEQVAGCLLRHSPGNTRRRTNSALPLVEAAARPADRIEAIEFFYAERASTPQVQVSPLDVHGDLDGALESRGYRAHTPTLVLATTSAAVLRAGRDHSTLTTTVHSGLTPEWATFQHELAGGYDPIVEQTLPVVPPPTGFVLARLHDSTVGIALFAASDDWAGVFCMATRPQVRRRGVASALLRAGARWAADTGADRLYLQVTEDNAAARRLYTGHGFRLSHHYHYRCLDAPASAA